MSASDKLSKDISDIKKLLMLELYYVHKVPAELIAKIMGLNPNSIRNMFPKEKAKGAKGKPDTT